MLLCCMTKLHWMDSCITTENNRNHIYLFVCMHVKAKCIYKWLVLCCPFFCFVNHLHNTIHTHTHTHTETHRNFISRFFLALFFMIFLVPIFFLHHRLRAYVCTNMTLSSRWVSHTSMMTITTMATTKTGTAQ